MSDLNKYLALAKEQHAKNLAKWGKQDFDTLYCVLTEEWGEFVRAINQWRWQGGPVAAIEAEAVDTLAVVFAMSRGPLEPMSDDTIESAHQTARELGWESLCFGGNRSLSKHDEAPLTFIVIMLAKALTEEAAKVKA